MISQVTWPSGSLRCGSRWGAAAPASSWVWESTLSWVYWRPLLSWTNMLTTTTKISNHIHLSSFFFNLTSGWGLTCPPSCWRAVGGFQRSGCGTPTGPEPKPPAGSPARSTTHTHTHTSVLRNHAGPESGLAPDFCSLFFHHKLFGVNWNQGFCFDDQKAVCSIFSRQKVKRPLKPEHPMASFIQTSD